MRFGAEFRDLYVAFIDRLIDTGDVARAFVVQERYRAYERRRLLAGRVPLPALDAPGLDLRELAGRIGPGSAVLSYVVADDSTIAFALRPGAEPSVVARRIPAGAAATERNVRAGIADADLLHFATHAVVDGARPLDAFVQLRGTAGERGGDGRLDAWEVLSDFELDSSLVTLSACPTGLGRQAVAPVAGPAGAAGGPVRLGRLQARRRRPAASGLNPTTE